MANSFAVSPSWNLRQDLETKIEKSGGWVNAHLHLDRAFVISPEILPLADATLQEKWDLVDDVKRNSSVDQIYDRMAFGVEKMLAQAITALCTFIDVDPVIEDKAIRAAQRIRDHYGKQLPIKFANQSLKGILAPEVREWFLRAAEFVDIIGGLPGKDHGHEAEHIDLLLSTAKKMGKMAHVHVDQFNSSTETETELLTDKTLEYGLHGKVVAVHSVSVSAHPVEYRQALYQKMQQAGMMVICCPTAWIDSRRSENLVPSHNSIAPVEELIAAGIPVAIGSDNVADIYKPFTDGDIWTELRFLLESCHYYDIEQLTKIASSNGRKVLGLE